MNWRLLITDKYICTGPVVSVIMFCRNISHFHLIFISQVFEPIAMSLSQIYGSTDLGAGILILVAMCVFSPILCLHAILASIVSIFTGECQRSHNSKVLQINGPTNQMSNKS